MNDNDDLYRLRSKRLDRRPVPSPFATGIPAMAGYVTSVPSPTFNPQPFVSMQPKIISGDEVEGGSYTETNSGDPIIIAGIGKRPLAGHDTIAGFFPSRWAAFIRSDTICDGGDTTVCLTFFRKCVSVGAVAVDQPGSVSVTGPNGYTASGTTSAGSPFCFTMSHKGTYTVTYTPDNTCKAPGTFTMVQDCSLAGTTETINSSLNWKVDPTKVTACCHDDCDCPPPKTLYMSTKYGTVTLNWNDSTFNWEGSITGTEPDGAYIFCCANEPGAPYPVYQYFWSARRGSTTVTANYAVDCAGRVGKGAVALRIATDPCTTRSYTNDWYLGNPTTPAPCFFHSTTDPATTGANATGTGATQSWCPVNFSASLIANPHMYLNPDGSWTASPTAIEETVSISE